MVAVALAFLGVVGVRVAVVVVAVAVVIMVVAVAVVLAMAVVMVMAVDIAMAVTVVIPMAVVMVMAVDIPMAVTVVIPVAVTVVAGAQGTLGGSGPLRGKRCGGRDKIRMLPRAELLCRCHCVRVGLQRVRDEVQEGVAEQAAHSKADQHLEQLPVHHASAQPARTREDSAPACSPASLCPRAAYLSTVKIGSTKSTTCGARLMIWGRGAARGRVDDERAQRDRRCRGTHQSGNECAGCGSEVARAAARRVSVHAVTAREAKENKNATSTVGNGPRVLLAPLSCSGVQRITRG
jgi:hypothetical protein